MSRHETAIATRANATPRSVFDLHEAMMKLLAILAANAALLGAALTASADDFEIPVDESPAESLPPTQVMGENFHVQDPVHSDGLMHHYVVDSRFGVFHAYGHDALTVRLREVAALTTIARTSDANVVLQSVSRGIQDDARAALQVAKNPIGTVLGIPKGIAHLLQGYQAQAEEISANAQKSAHAIGSQSAATTTSKAASQVTEQAKRYGERYLGLSAAERRWYEKLGADPYTTNEVLRRAVSRLARIDAAASLGMRFAPIGIPFAGEVDRVLKAIYTEDPAVLRKRRHEELASQGLSPAEIAHFENTLLLNPTRQALLIDAVRALDGVEGRVELLRHAAEVTSEDEIEVFLHSTALLLRFQKQRPVARILPGLRVPTALLADGSLEVFGAFDAVQWTEDVAGYERDIHATIPENVAARELWLTASASPRARAELERLGWTVHDRAETVPIG
jgi:hypothetical protein